METILIVGITGFLGRNLSKKIWHEYKDKYKIIGTGLSPSKISLFKSLRRGWGAYENDIPCKLIDIYNDYDKLEDIFKRNKIDYVIHLAALKYIDIAEKEPIKCIETNIIGTLNLLKCSNKYSVKNMIALSTDKANNPINTYGMSKYLMEQSVLYYNYSIYQGVNFFWSDGSVTDLWYRQLKKGENLCVTNPEQIRYYSEVNDICIDILSNINNCNRKIIPSNIFEIKLNDLYLSFIKYFNYDNDKKYFIGDRTNEKYIEIIDKKINNITVYNESQIIDLIDKTIKNII